MRNKLFSVGLLALLPLAAVGCHSTSQLAWWKSPKSSDIEATAIAHSAAPQLPSEAAKQAEKLAATDAANGGGLGSGDDGPIVFRIRAGSGSS